MLDAVTTKRFEDALAADDLHGLAMQMKAQGLSHVAIYVLFEAYMEVLNDAKREPEWDRMYDSMDGLSGFCSSHQRWFDHILTNEEIDHYRKTGAADDAKWLAARAEVVRVASDIIDGRIDVITGSRRLVGLRFMVRAEEDPNFLSFVGIDSETDRFPMGEDRRHWNAEALARYDAEREKAEQFYEPLAVKTAKELVRKFSGK